MKGLRLRSSFYVRVNLLQSVVMIDNVKNKKWLPFILMIIFYRETPKADLGQWNEGFSVAHAGLHHVTINMFKK